MSWHDKIYRYCERAGDPGFWAEPFNALSNAAFLVAALLAAYHFGKSRSRGGGAGAIEAAMIALVAVIGIGSFLFHTYATRWASYADTVPIGLFMIAYLVYALRHYAGAPWMVIVIALAGFVWSLKMAGSVECTLDALPITGRQGGCLNGSVGYLPAFAAMTLIGLLLAVMRHPAAGYLIAAAAVFALSLTCRTLDLELCGLTTLAGHTTGTHFLWHCLNATLLYILLRAAIRCRET